MSADEKPRIPARPSVSSSVNQPAAAVAATPPSHIAMASMAAKPRNSHIGPAAPVQPAQINGNGMHAPIGVGVSTSGVGYTQHSQAELSPLWQSVGLETLSGVHNYDPRCLELERVELEALHDEFLAHRKLFGFQADNVRNQMEHLCFLIQNARDRYGPAAYQYLHNRFFSNYRRWCKHINAQRWCFQKRMKHAFDSPSYGDRNKIQDLVLWLLIWGEAANMRHAPEYLCFVFYRMSAERQRVIDSGVIATDHTEDEWFRVHVIQPAYNIAFAMQQYVRNNGSLKDHPKRPNYDDLNEYFWNRRWLDHNKNYHDEDVEKFWGIKYNKGFLIDLDPKTGKVVVQKEGSKADRQRKDAARLTLKTFPEKRSWLNLFRSFFRIVELHAFAFHILILFGYGFAQKRDLHNIGSAVLTPAALTVLLEIVEFSFYYGVIYSQGLFFNFLLRLIVYSAVFLVLFGLYWLQYAHFFWIAVAYMALRVTWELFNVTTHRWIRKWHMSEDRNFESDVASQLGWWRRVGSTIFWIVIFMLKCFYSYFIYVKPIITITHTLVNIKGWVGAAGVGPDNEASTSNWLLVVLLWMPTLIMFAIDTQIFFSTSIVFIGVILGVRDRVCNVRSWDDIEKGFTYSWRNGARKFFGGRDELRHVAVEAAGQHKGVLNLPPLISPPWHLIQVMWKEIINEMRAADHTSFHDHQLLQFGHFTYQTENKQIQETFFLPPFVTAGQVGTFIEMLGELQDAKDRRLGGMSMILREIKQQLKSNETMRTALDEIYTAGTLLLQTFIPHGPVHFNLNEGNKLLEYTCRQKKPYSFLKDVMKSLENATTECIALCFDKGHQNIIRKKPTTTSIANMQEETFYGQQPFVPDVINTKPSETALTALYKFWVMIAEGAGSGLDAAKASKDSAAIASNVAPPKVVYSAVDNLANNELGSLLRTIFHLLSTPMMDARPASRTVADRLMFFLSSLNTSMPDRQNSIKEMYSWTVLTPYVEELVIYTPEELEMPNAEGITADFYLKTTYKKEWMHFLERLAADPLGADPSYRLVQKREWCSFRGQTLLRTVRGMIYYEKACKIMALLELARGSHWSAAQERVAKAISQRKFQYVLSCQKYGAFKNARARRDRGELIDKANLPDLVRIERKKLLDEAQKADDIEYILRKYPHLRIAYVDDRTINGEKVFASVLVKALVREDGRSMPASAVLGAVGSYQKEDLSIGGGSGNVGSADKGAIDPRNRGMGGQEVGAGIMIEDPALLKSDDHGHPGHKLFVDSSPDARLGVKNANFGTLGGGGADASDIQEIYRVRLPGNVLIGEGKPENQNHAMIFTRGEFLEAIDMNQDNYLEEAFKFRNLLEEFDPLRSPDVKAHRDELQRPNPANNGADGSRASDNGILKCAILGFRENIFTANLMSVGTYMSLMEATFVSMTLRTFAWLGARMHYGHPDCISFGTRVALANGDSIAAEDIVAGQKLVGEDGTVVEVEFAEHAETKHAFTITTAAGPLTVSSGHKLTLRCNRGPHVFVSSREREVNVSGSVTLNWVYADTLQEWETTQSFIAPPQGELGAADLPRLHLRTRDGDIVPVDDEAAAAAAAVPQPQRFAGRVAKTTQYATAEQAHAAAKAVVKANQHDKSNVDPAKWRSASITHEPQRSRFLIQYQMGFKSDGSFFKSSTSCRYQHSNSARPVIQGSSTDAIRQAAKEWLAGVQTKDANGAQLVVPLQAGQLVEVTAEELHKRWKEWHMGTSHALFSARRVPLPVKLPVQAPAQAASHSALVTDENVAAYRVAAELAHPLAAADGQKVCMDYSLAVTGPASYEPLSSTAGHQAKIVYQLHNPLVDATIVNALGNKCYTFLQLERMHKQLQIDLSRDTGLVMTELNPIASGTGQMASTEQRYDAVCLATMRAAISAASVTTVVAFGKHCRHRWQAHANELSDAGVPAVTRVFGRSKGLLLYVNGREVRVIFSPHPSAWYAVDCLVHAVAEAHGVAKEITEAVIESAAVERVDIKSIEPLNPDLPSSAHPLFASFSSHKSKKARSSAPAPVTLIAPTKEPAAASLPVALVCSNRGKCSVHTAPFLRCERKDCGDWCVWEGCLLAHAAACPVFAERVQLAATDQLAGELMDVTVDSNKRCRDAAWRKKHDEYGRTQLLTNSSETDAALRTAQLVKEGDVAVKRIAAVEAEVTAAAAIPPPQLAKPVVAPFKGAAAAADQEDEPAGTKTIRIVNIGIKGDRKRYALADGTLTHNCLDKIFFMTRGGMSKASKMIHVSEDIFAGFKSTLRGGRILHKEYIQCGKGRDLGFNQLYLFEAKLASGAGEQALSREAYRLGRYLDLPRLLSFFYGSIGFYTTTAMIVIAIGSLLFARMMLALTGIDGNVMEFNRQFGVSVGLLQASSVYQLGLLLILPMLAEIALEKTLVKAFTTYLWMLMTGASFFFFFHLQTKAFFFNNSVMFGGAKYRATGRGFVLSRDSFTRIYRTYARSHIYPAIKLLFMMVVFGIFNNTGTNWFFEMWAPLLLVIAWLYSPMWFNPMAFDHDKVTQDFHEWRRWLDRKSQNEETSWQGWWVMETEYMTRTPRSTKFWLTLFNLVIPILVIAACISSLEATSVSRVYFLMISVGGTVGLVLVGLFLVYQFHPVGDTFRWLKFFLGIIVLALLIVTIIFDTGTTSFGWKGTNFAVYLIVIALTFNTICKVLMIHGAGPYRFGFCLTWFKMCDTIFGLIVYGPWLVFSFIGLASIQTRLLYNRAFFRGLRVSELLQQDPNKRDKFRSRPAQLRKPGVQPLSSTSHANGNNGKGHQAGFTPVAMTRENSMDDLRAAGMRPRTGLQAQVGEHSYLNRSKNYSHFDNGVDSEQNSPTNRSYGGSRRGSMDDGVSPEQRTRMMGGGAGASGRGSIDGGASGQHLAPPGAAPVVGQGSLLIYSQSPSGGGAAGPSHPPHRAVTPKSGRSPAGSTVPSAAAPARDDDEKSAQPRYTYG